MKLRICATLVFSLTLARFAYAEPHIVSTSGTFSHYSNFTVVGNNFGLKSSPLPVKWDHCESGDVNSNWDVVQPWGSQNLGNYGKVGAYRSKGEIDGWGSPYGGGVDPPHARSTKYFCANAYAAPDPVCGGDPDGVPGGTQTRNDNCGLGMLCSPQKIYVSYYYRVDPDWSFVGAGTDGNMKMFDCRVGDGFYDGVGYYMSFRHYEIGHYPQPVGLRIGVALNYDQGGCNVESGADITTMPTHPLDGWGHHEYIFDLSDTPNGYVKVTVDGTVIFERDNCQIEDWQGQDPLFVGVGGFHRNYGCAPANAANWRYFDDIYFDTTFSRVILANSSDYDSASIIEPQIPSAWNDSSITCTVNLGKLPSSGTAYLFVFDANNNHNPVGYPVELGGGGDEGTPPSPPTGLKILE